MQLQVEQANRSFRSSSFAAFHAQRLYELRERIGFLCASAWDINAAWLVRQDVQVLIEQTASSEPDVDVSTWELLLQSLDAALELGAVPAQPERDGLLEQFRRIDIATSTPGRSYHAIRQVENDRVESPPPSFWRRWSADAPPPAYSRGAASATRQTDDKTPFDLGQVDIDAMIAAGGVGQSSVEIVQERMAPDLVGKADESAGLDPADDFIQATDDAPESEGYDWGLESAPQAKPVTDVVPGRSLDDFWETTAGAEASQPPSAPVVPTSTPQVSPPSTATAAVPSAPTPTPTPTPTPVSGAAQQLAPSAGATPPRATPPAKAPPAQPPAQPKLLSGSGQRIYHLTESDDLACELDQRLEQLGYELELLDSAEELNEVLGALTPNLILVDMQFQPELEGIGAVLRVARQRASDPIRLLVLCEADTMEVRLSARRAGADELLFRPQTSDEVLAGIERILHGLDEERARVLIVEDDRAQGLFAQSILRNAGMDAEVVEDGLKVLDTMRRFQPDLVLMDLYMPNYDGAELTALIRERDEFVHTPIVFLSGESDTDKHYEALSAGGDDFLSKPIRPKYLIATVNNRVRRARAIRKRNAQVAQPEPFDRGTGLHFRAAMLERLEQALVESKPAERIGGVLFIEIENIPALRQSLGLTTVEDLLEDAAQFIVDQLGSGTMASRYGDACFVVFDTQSEPEQLYSRAEQLRDAVAFNPFDTPKEMITLDVTVGAADLRQPFADAAAVLNAAEHASRSQHKEAPTPVSEVIRPPDPVHEERIAMLLSDAVETGRLDLDYQPIVALQGNEQGQYQTLLRLRLPDEAAITAGELLPVLRAQNRLPEFDRWVLTRALEVIASRLALARPVTLFVSQSVETLRQRGYADWLAAQLGVLGRAGESLVIEISAGEIGLDLDAITTLCTRLVPEGVRFCLSHYSGGDEQAGLLEVLPADLVKLAPQLVAGLGSSERRAEFSALVEQLHERGTSVIASRIEDTRTAAVLWMSGIDHIQGNLVQLAGSSLDFDFNAAVL